MYKNISNPHMITLVNRISSAKKRCQRKKQLVLALIAQQPHIYEKMIKKS